MCNKLLERACSEKHFFSKSDSFKVDEKVNIDAYGVNLKRKTTQ